MSTTMNLYRALAEKISDISTKVAKTSTKACVTMLIEEPKMPKSLLKKAE